MEQRSVAEPAETDDAVDRVLGRAPGVLGIVNVTPDSFSDGALWSTPDDAARHGSRLVHEGAVALDVGAESTRPGATPVPPDVEARRLLPALRALRNAVEVPLSVDTRNASTAAAALQAGATILNDVSGLRHDPDLARVAAEGASVLVLMHSRGTPETMRELATYEDVAREVRDELARSVDVALAAGCPETMLVLDPGFGFAKTPAQSWELLTRLDELLDLGRPLLVGVSRKSMIGWALRAERGERPAPERAAGSVGAGLAAIARGARWLRVHDVRMHADAVRTFSAGLTPTSRGTD